MLTQIEAWEPGPSVQVVRLSGGPLPGNRQSCSTDIGLPCSSMVYFLLGVLPVSVIVTAHPAAGSRIGYAE